MAPGQVGKPPAHLIKEIGELLEENKFGCIGTGIGSDIKNTNELKVLGFKETMASADKDDSKASVDHEHEWMLKNGAWEVVDCHNILQGADIIDSMWAMKKKANGEYHARLATRGFKQAQGKYVVYCNISSPVIHDITVHIMLVLVLMGNMIAHLVDVNGDLCQANSSLLKIFT